ncbi:hypothetical protein [Alicyclobacillus sp. SO9]|uniref:hypothetical protein n=1 Tax=Alicyclobacillus sp. SO9 TaxID=2665646 RepID=UPI0018E7499E|nr:hypothetical protein [Alicyclobacillus sp. SO9]QQE78290.1 hypothetical protein GI364_20800 [Alicyclobacillus sp. SO9]
MNFISILRGTLSVAMVAAGASGLGVFGYGLTQQAKIQKQMDGTLQQVNHSVKQTTGLVQHTSKILSPLDSTTRALAAMENQEKSVVLHLNGMNHTLGTMATTEQQTITILSQLNQTEQSVTQRLQNVSDVNGQILSANKASVGQANWEAAHLASMNSMTGLANQHLHVINQRLSALKLLP